MRERIRRWHIYMRVIKTEWWGAGIVICLELGADLHMAQLMPLPLTVSCFSKIQTGFTFLVPDHPGGPGKKAVKRVCVCVCVIKTNNDSCEPEVETVVQKHIAKLNVTRV